MVDSQGAPEVQNDHIFATDDIMFRFKPSKEPDIVTPHLWKPPQLF